MFGMKEKSILYYRSTSVALYFSVRSETGALLRSVDLPVINTAALSAAIDIEIQSIAAEVRPRGKHISSSS